jgi:hypothetical protein
MRPTSSSCSGGQLTGEDGEIDRGGKEVVRLDITNLLATYGNFQINADSATDGELLGVFYEQLSDFPWHKDRRHYQCAEQCKHYPYG